MQRNKQERLLFRDLVFVTREFFDVCSEPDSSGRRQLVLLPSVAIPGKPPSSRQATLFGGLFGQEDRCAHTRIKPRWPRFSASLGREPSQKDAQREIPLPQYAVNG